MFETYSISVLAFSRSAIDSYPKEHTTKRRTEQPIGAELGAELWYILRAYRKAEFFAQNV